ncbi:MAG: putative peptidoglycan glycosyltransferase FtsW [Gemmiger sp.]|nr:putative peptidoglycan glycosyltransferase FtsW [Gemmiger sp.]
MDFNQTVKRLYANAQPLSRGLFFRKAERGPVSWYFVATILIILAYGLVMMFSASYPTGYYRYNGDSYYFIRQQLIFAGFGVVAMAIGASINYRWVRRWTWAIYAVTILLLIGALFTTTQTSEFHRWVNLFGVQFQPSEIAKFSMILSTAMLVDRYRNQRNTLKFGFLYPMAPVAPLLVLLAMEPHWSGMILMMMIFFTMLLCVGCALRWLVPIMLAAGAGVAFLLVSQNNYVQTRLEGWTLFSGDTSGMTYQTRQSMYSIASGGLLGLGIGNSRQKHLWLPEATNDFIFSVVCEELGFVGAVLCIGLFAALIIQGILIALRSPDLFGTVLGIGIIAQVAWQVFCNIGVVTNTIPNTGISLPFFSSGGTSLLMLLAEMGLLLSISRAGNAQIAAQRRRSQAAFADRLNRPRQVYRQGM